MLDQVKHITIGETEYPLAFTLNVAEEIQERYGSIDKWSKSMSGEDEPKMKDVITTFELMINEGIDIENDDVKEKRAFLTHKQVGRLISKMGASDSIEKIFETFTDSMGTGKNVQTTQNKEKQ